MASVIGGEPAFLGSLNDLIELNRDMVEVIVWALSRVDRPGDRSLLTSFLEDHERHLQALSALARELGGCPGAAVEARPRPVKGRMPSGWLVGDRAILEAMKAIEEDACSAYERAASREGLPEGTRKVLEESLKIERRHRDWVEEQLDARQGLMLLLL
jgi:hypothetical protein